MTYVYKSGKDNPKSKSFTKTLDITKFQYIEKGSILTIDDQRCQVVSLRKIEVVKGFIKVSGKCLPVTPSKNVKDN